MAAAKQAIKLGPALRYALVIESDGNSFRGDVVLYSVNKTSRNM